MAGSYNAWKARQAGRPALLGIAGVGFLITFYGSYFYLYKPWVKRRKIAQAEEYAIFLESLPKQN